MGGKGGAGKTTVLSHRRLSPGTSVPFDLFDADIENDKRGNLKLYFPEAEKVNISTERGLDIFVDKLFGEISHWRSPILAREPEPTRSHGLTRCTGFLPMKGFFLRCRRVRAGPGQRGNIFSWASKLRDRVSYLIVKNERDSEDFPYFDGTPEGAKFKELPTHHYSLREARE